MFSGGFYSEKFVKSKSPSTNGCSLYRSFDKSCYASLCLRKLQLNPGQVGFYRVQYSSAMLELLLPAIKDNSLPPRDRLGLQSDIFALVCLMITAREMNLILRMLSVSTVNSHFVTRGLRRSQVFLYDQLNIFW